MDSVLIISFLWASIALTVMPGPDNIFVLTESLSKGKTHGIFLSLGLSLGVLFHISLAAFGLSYFITQNEFVFNAIKYIGAGYIFYLAYLAFQELPPQIEETSTQEYKPPIHQIRKGLIMNVLNPKVSIFFLAFFPQFIRKTEIPVVIQMFVLGGIFIIQAFIIFSLIAIFSATIRSYIYQKNVLKNIAKIKAIILIAIGIYLLF